MKVLITGGAGYLGGALTDILKARGVDFTVYDSLVYEESYRKDVPFILGDIRDQAKLKKLLPSYDTVVWLAALVGDGACAINGKLSKEINQDSVEWLSTNFDGRILFTSTCSVYGAQDGELNEESPTNPLSIYASTKLAAEKFLVNRNSMVFRLGTLFGVGDLFARLRLDLVVNFLTMLAATEGELSVFGGDQFRPLLHVSDIAEVIADNLSSSHRGVFNVHRQNTRIKDVASQIRAHFPDVKMEFTEMQFQDSRNYRVSSQKLISTTGWRSDWSIDDGIEQIKRLFEEGRLQDAKNPRYSNQSYLNNMYTALNS